MKGINKIYAYMRISTTKSTQKTDRQRYTIEEYAKQNNFTVDRFFKEVITGGTKAAERPVYSQLVEQLRQGDTLIFTDVDRLGRNADDVILELKRLQGLGVRVIILDIPFMNDYFKMSDDSISKMIIDIYITLKAHLAEQEKEKINVRVKQGLETAKAKGVKLGRPSTGVPKKFKKEYKRLQAGEYGTLKVVDFCKIQGIAVSTFYKYRALLEKENN